MNIDWGAFGGVFAVSLGITLLTVVLFSLGIAAWSRDDGEGGARTRAIRTASTAAAALCFGACLAVAGYGLALIIGV
ncbi:hypothetical protein [Streptomyces sp. HUAS TT20]|uniref:hypothetical protein n=1 Tax=Streptomyces sp. HUAS TT20 TaxID=3447509 RepID=UPI0021D96315|nr:hypothetical protein [Streptomyces sp. HUAS 15-9]UXY25488.1 hypothetical protein N8I87_02170 [Streptomyces sp. HUAS 15-9]